MEKKKKNPDMGICLSSQNRHWNKLYTTMKVESFNEETDPHCRAAELQDHVAERRQQKRNSRKYELKKIADS